LSSSAGLVNDAVNRCISGAAYLGCGKGRCNGVLHAVPVQRIPLQSTKLDRTFP
jgi:hypothetical protein